MDKDDQLLQLSFLRLHVDGTEYAIIPASQSQSTLDSVESTIFLGGRLYGRLILSNPSFTPLNSLRIRLELQTTTQRSILFDSDPNQLIALPPNNMLPIDCTHDVGEVGVHILVVSVHYSLPSPLRGEEEKMFLRKFYQLNAINPLILKTKVTTILTHNMLFLEAQLQNNTSETFTLDAVTFEPAEGFAAYSLPSMSKGNTLPVLESKDDENVLNSVSDLRLDDNAKAPNAYYSSLITLAAESIYQFVFTLRYENVVNFTETPHRLGRMDISWRSEEGQLGRLQTAALSHQDPPPLQDHIMVSLRSVPPLIEIEQPFEVMFLFRNCTNFDIDNLTLLYSHPALSTDNTNKDITIESLPPIILLGVHEVHLGDLTNANTTRFKATLLVVKEDATQPAGIVSTKEFEMTYEIAGIKHRRTFAFQLRINDAPPS